jgi:hypothetical protein
MRRLRFAGHTRVNHAMANLKLELAALKKEAKNDGGFFLDPSYGEVTLTREPADIAHYTGTANGETWESLFKEVNWVGAEADGGMIGWWDGAVLYLDNEGTLTLTGRTLVDHFAARHGKDEPLDALVAFCKRAKLPPPLSPAARAKSLRGAGDPNKRFEDLEAKAAKSGGKAAKAEPGVRPVDRAPFCAVLCDGGAILFRHKTKPRGPPGSG